MTQGINNQNLFNNTQFQQFVEFANTSKAGSIAKATTTALIPDGKPHSITGTSESFLSKLFRSGTTKEANNYTRTIFKESIAKMFGGESNIPDNVKEAMHMDAFGKGKPLTARRILAVKAAIDQVAEKHNTSVEECKAQYKRYNGTDKSEQAHKLVDTAFAACHGNSDAMDIVKKNIDNIVVNAQSSFRTEADIQKKVEGMVANLNELKGLSQKNPGIYAAGKTMLIGMAGKSLPQGMLTKLVQAANEAPINDLRKLSGSSPAMSIHKATIGLYKSITNAMVSSGAEKKLDGAEEKVFTRMFLASAIMSRCSKSALMNIHSALNTETAPQLKQYYSLCSIGKNPFVEDEPMDVQDGVKEAGSVGDNYLGMIDDSVNQNLERLDPNKKMQSMPNFDGDIVIEDIGGSDLIEDTVSIAKELNAQKVQDYIDQTVEGTGKGADAFRKVLQNKLGNSSNPAEYLSKSISYNGKAMMNWSLCGEMKKIVTGKESQFEKDIYRGPKITLTDGKTTFNITREFNAARNELAQFVTGNKEMTYEKLETADKNKVHLLMALVSQETEKASENGLQHALHPRESEDGVLMDGDKFNRGPRTYTITKMEDGGISLHYTTDKPIIGIHPDYTNDDFSVGEGSKFTCALDYTLKGTEFQRLSELDYTKFDDTEASKVFNKMMEMPDGSRQYAEHKLETAVDTFTQEFKIDATCKMDFNMKLMPTNEELIA
ncbi:MAG: hypothetical protein J6X55_02575 [Victivallales bacterium]|nr:hypothetical protein [Victivallales bacterium]